jgi:hypothetical protein|tara:strand:+ start:758 stop:967 length:210 start_codon:yes stop_codon:yes gene_type:complete
MSEKEIIKNIVLGLDMKLVVLDFRKDITYIYTKLDIKGIIDQTEQILYDLGHDASNCQWMLTKNEIIIK